jgi:hypothetical protein
MAEKLVIADLEFETIKQNLKTFLNTQSTFLDYNFEGSSLAILVNLLAFNTYYNAFYMNMMANELFIDSAQVRNSLLSHAKSLNYTPVSRRAPTAIVTAVVTPPGGNTQSLLTMDRFTEFQSQAIDGVNYTFVTTAATSVYKESGVFTFTSLQIKAGTPQIATFTYDALSNPASQFELPNDDIDTSTLLVTVQESSVNTSSQVFALSTDITESTANTAVYYLSPTTSNKYQLTFGDGEVSKALANGNIVIASYLSTGGIDANKANSFATGSIGGFSNVTVASVSSASGGAERETDDSIRQHAPLSYTSQGRAVTQKDYESLLKQSYPNIQSIFVWGGEDNIPPVYGKVFISIAPKEGVIINDAEKVRIATDILGPISILTITPELVDPDYVYLKFETTVEVDGKLTLLTSAQITDTVRTAIVNYADTTFNQFGAIFVISKFGRAVDDSLPAIIGSDTAVRLEKRIVPSLNVRTTYTVSFSTELRHAPIQRALKSTAFTVHDTSNVLRTAYIEEVFNSSTGVDSISITNPGYNYIEAPTIIVTGDGSGAEAVATIVNGRIDTITVTKRGTSYTSAIVTITGGGGQAAAASAVVQSKFGTLRTFYYNSNSEKVDINPSIGTVDYFKGELVIRDLTVVESLTDAGDIRISVEPEASIIETQQNQLLLLDSDDVSAINISVIVR